MKRSPVDGGDLNSIVPVLAPESIVGRLCIRFLVSSGSSTWRKCEIKRVVRMGVRLPMVSREFHR